MWARHMCALVHKRLPPPRLSRQPTWIILLLEYRHASPWLWEPCTFSCTTRRHALRVTLTCTEWCWLFVLDLAVTPLFCRTVICAVLALSEAHFVTSRQRGESE